MLDISWSSAEKKIAGAAFDRAYERECSSLRNEAQSMLESAPDSQVIWRLEEYLRKRRRESVEKYDYRYSVLMLVLTRLHAEGLLTDDNLAGLGAENLEFITTTIRILTRQPHDSRVATPDPGWHRLPWILCDHESQETFDLAGCLPKKITLRGSKPPIWRRFVSTCNASARAPRFNSKSCHGSSQANSRRR